MWKVWFVCQSNEEKCESPLNLTDTLWETFAFSFSIYYSENPVLFHGFIGMLARFSRVPSEFGTQNLVLSILIFQTYQIGKRMELFRWGKTRAFSMLDTASSTWKLILIDVVFLCHSPYNALMTQHSNIIRHCNKTMTNIFMRVHCFALTFLLFIPVCQN